MIPLRLREFADDCKERIRALREAACRAQLASIDPTHLSDDRRAHLEELQRLVGQKMAKFLLESPDPYITKAYLYYPLIKHQKFRHMHRTRGNSRRFMK